MSGFHRSMSPQRQRSMESVMKGVPNIHSVTSQSRTFSALSERERKSTYNRVTYDLFHTPAHFPQQFEKIKHNIDEKIQHEDDVHIDIKPHPKKNVQFRTSVDELLPPEVPSAGAKKIKAGDYDVDEHTIPLEELASKFVTHIDFKDTRNSQGLDMDFAKRRLELTGPNALKPPKQRPWFIKFLLHFVNFFMLLLQAAGVLCFVAYALDMNNKINLYLGIVLFAIVIFTCTISFFQDRQSSNIMNSFKNMLPQACKVVRNGVETRIAVEDLVIGDVVIVNGGDKVPADIRILYSNGLKVDNSSLTGESDPQTCVVKCTDENPLETHNLAFYGTLAMDGSAYGMVIRTGPATLIGHIADMASESSVAETTLQREIKRFVRFISVLGIAMGVVFFGIGFAVGTKVIPNLINVLGIIVANVPEGLPSTVTV